MWTVCVDRSVCVYDDVYLEKEEEERSSQLRLVCFFCLGKFQ